MDDLASLSCPPKFRAMHTFHNYYSGTSLASVPLLFVGGNHEASSHLREVFHGGWIAPNMYYLGAAGAVSFNGIRIAGISGIYKSHDYHKGHFEIPPYNSSSLRSAYHTRSIEVFQLKALRHADIDVFVSHDWPTGIALKGDLDELLRIKSFLRKEIADGSFGSPPLADLLDTLEPKYWFAAHMHVKYPAIHTHASGAKTKFLALDKIRPGGDFLQVVDVEPTTPFEPAHPSEANALCYDPLWMAALKETYPLMNFTSARTQLPTSLPDQPSADAVTAMRDAIVAANGSLAIPANFVRVDPFAGGVYHPGSPQTVALLALLGIDSPALRADDYVELSPTGTPSAPPPSLLPQPPQSLLTPQQPLPPAPAGPSGRKPLVLPPPVNTSAAPNADVIHMSASSSDDEE
ncbi:lariat debranching enzyme [Thecamonas trahens ATCC 50062]|uniref:Lariat debranching enzyme n=1 Tax=Thecamonas trahens ATCC 50062 TaxID=461836 RepID=A0A0L0DRC4_THETB|nr:lariat debranching enzyme [Thecamonas trahens ATCC 50062]KNC53998.1 lariat debranching enzyme [Thecamonas trahens ATCC 50062]|eukprot:XP_013754199.1 lariat debranching enzyme [Thecamonas trahens ATCC 50062]